MTRPGDSLPDRTGEELSQEEKDQIRNEFGARLRELLQLTKLSSRQFAGQYPAYKDSTIRKYTSGRNMPAWDFLRDLLAEATRRNDSPVSAERTAELFAAYRLALVRLGAVPHGSDQNSLLLRLFDGEQALHQLNEEIGQTRERENQLRSDLEELRATPQGEAARTQVARLERESQELAQRHSVLASRRMDLLGDLDRGRQHLSLLEAAEHASEPPLSLPPPQPPAPPGHISTGGAHQPPPEAFPPPVPPQRSRRHLLIGLSAVAAVLLVAGGVIAGAQLANNDSPEHGDTAGSEKPGTSQSPEGTASRTPSGKESPEATEHRTSASMANDISPLPQDIGNYSIGEQRVNAKDFPITLYSGVGCYDGATWNIDRKYKHLRARVGISQDSEPGTAITFTVEVDKKEKKRVTVNDPGKTETINVDVSNALRVYLGVDAEDGCLDFGNAKAVWIDPVLSVN